MLLDTTPHTERLTSELGSDVSLPCGLPPVACPTLCRLQAIAPGVTGAITSVAGEAAEPLTVALDVRCGWGPCGTCRLSVSFAAGRIAVIGTEAGPAEQVVH